METIKIIKYFVYDSAIAVSKFSNKIINSIDRKLEQQEIAKWFNLFGKNDKIVFNLQEINFNLYKDSILSKFIYDGFEKKEVDFMLNTLKEDDIFIDIGSNIGLFSLLASKKVGVNGKVICFEPAPITYKRLLENIELNQLQNVIALNLGLSDNVGELKFYYSDTGFDAWNSFAPDSRLKKSIKIKTSTLDLQLENIDKEQIKMVKIDVEGWEKFVIQGGETFFKNYSPIVMVEFTEENTFNAGYNIHDIFGELETLGYDWFRIVNGELVQEVKTMHYPYINLIAKKKTD